ncbi:MAG: hypothetical protein EHM61_28690 [Acidobacteria bacterium]|nr:MAG: hypothetical protein EHM61_28690 [Acidobacteriota bacterium]
MFHEIGLQVKRASQSKTTFVTGDTNGSVGYMPTQAAFAEGGYEPDASTFEALRTVDAVLLPLARLTDRPAVQAMLPRRCLRIPASWRDRVGVSILDPPLAPHYSWSVGVNGGHGFSGDPGLGGGT